MIDREIALFRAEVIASRKMRLEGEVILTTPLSAQLIVILLSLCAIIGVVFLTTGRFSRVERAKGILNTDAEAAKIIALKPGIVIRLSVSEGDKVRQGQPLATIQVEQQYAEGARATQEEITAVKTQEGFAGSQIRFAERRAQSERAGYAAAAQSAREQQVDVSNQERIQDKLVSSLQNMLNRYGPIADKGFISRTEIDRREQELLVAQQGLSRLRQQLAVLKLDETRALTELGRSRADETMQTNTSRSAAAGFRVQQTQLKAEQSYVLESPSDGTVTALQTDIGKTVDSAVPLMTIIPVNVNVHADLYAPSRAIGFVKVGQEVRLLYDAFPFEHFGSYSGRIKAISRIALDPHQIDVPFKIDEPVYRIRVSVERQALTGYGQQVQLQPGMTLSADIILERRSFLNWLLEPLQAVNAHKS